jgi:hypothetical protein
MGLTSASAKAPDCSARRGAERPERFDLIASHREPVVTMLRYQPISDRLFIQEAGHVVDLASWTVALDLPTASG